MKKKKAVQRVILTIVMIIVSITMCLPLLWMISSSFKPETEVFSFPIKWIPETFRFENYKEVFERIPFVRYYINTLIIAVATTICQVITGSMSAYALSKIQFPGRDKIFVAYLCTLMVPYQVVMIPQFFILKNLGLVDSLGSVVLIGAFNAFGVFLFRQFFLSIPESLSEAARLDGCSEFRIYSRLIMPLSKPAISTLVIFTFVSSWNDFLGPLIYLTSDEVKTIQLGIREFQNLYNTEYALIMAAATIAIVPVIIVYLFAQNQFIEGLTSSGVKG